MIPKPHADKKMINESAMLHMALLIVYQGNKHYKKPIETEVLYTALDQALQNLNVLSEADHTPLRNRTDSAYQQRIRNLISHDALKKTGWINVLPKEPGSRIYVLETTDKGRDELLSGFVAMAPSMDFDALMSNKKEAKKTAAATKKMTP